MEWRSLKELGFPKYEMDADGNIRNNESHYIVQMVTYPSGRRNACLYGGGGKRHTRVNVDTLRKALWG
jgi:hypothetical protein